MQKIHSNSLRFLKMNIQNYGPFLGSHDFVFGTQQTLIIGEGGTGKTTIVNILKNLGPAPGVTPHFHAKPSKMSAEVATRGNRDLIQRFSSIIFLGCKSAELFTHKQKDAFADLLDDQQRKMIKVE